MSVVRPRVTFSMISGVVLYQTKGWRWWFQCSAQVSMAPIRSSTLVKTPRRSRRSVSCLNQPSARLTHDEEVGVKWRCQRALLGWARRTISTWYRKAVGLGVGDRSVERNRSELIRKDSSDLHIVNDECWH